MKSKLLVIIAGLILCPLSSIFAIDGAVTQATSVTTAVTLDVQEGLITTFSQSAAAGASATFTVNNTGIKIGNGVLVSIADYAGTIGTNGIPVVMVDDIAEDSFKIIVSNVHSANALSGALKIAFTIL